MFRKKSNKVTFNPNNIQDKAILDNVKKDFDKRVCEKFIKYKPKTGSEPIITVKNLYVINDDGIYSDSTESNRI
ncbi:hypothetical protein, partial [uncultured Brachyspira sp.]|uniref:hypothetical protein n=1 Tax=uncultured Brachyspira sp. TaxID=221953 RepID=UPI0026048E52